MFPRLLALSLTWLLLVAAGRYGGQQTARLEGLQARAAEQVRTTWAGTPIDAALSRAAQSLAEEAAAGASLDETTTPGSLRDRLARAGATAPELAPWVLRSQSAERALSRLQERLAGEAAGPHDHVGVGAASGPAGTAVVILRASHRVVLDPFPLEVTPGTPHRISGRLVAPLRNGTVHGIGPTGAPFQPAVHADGDRFAAVIHFALPGRYTLEVVGEGPDGPQVAAILLVWAGKAHAPAATARAPDEPDDAAGKAALAAELAAEMRARRGLPALRRDPALDAVAKAYAEELRESGRFAHRSPASGSIGDRLVRAGYAHRGAGENLAQAPTVAQAHEALIGSPAHLANLLDPRWTSAGWGVALAEAEGGVQVILVEVFAAGPGDG